MFSSIWTAVILGITSLSFLVYGLLKHEDRLQEMERKITANQEKFTNK